jgi:integrase/recombinase XerD
MPGLTGEATAGGVGRHWCGHRASCRACWPPAEVNALTGALRTDRDRAMVALMVHGGLRRCEVLGLRFEHVQVGDRRVFVADGKGGHQRLVPVADAFFTTLAAYLSSERPTEAIDDHVFVVLKGPQQGSAVDRGRAR